jgi:hypothetical protein
VTAASFASGPFRVVVDDGFAITVPMTLDAYLAYVMTETNVAQARAGGVSARAAREWCRSRLAPDFTGDRPVTFRCSLLVLRR